MSHLKDNLIRSQPSHKWRKKIIT